MSLTLGERVDDLLARWKATGRLLGELKSAVNANFKHAAARAPKAYLCRGSQLEDLVPRLTGARFVASSTAIFDLDLHEVVLMT
jgi:hypothetical protein